jgi:hypothetical protein
MSMRRKRTSAMIKKKAPIAWCSLISLNADLCHWHGQLCLHLGMTFIDYKIVYIFVRQSAEDAVLLETCWCGHHHIDGVRCRFIKFAGIQDLTVFLPRLC